MLNLNCIRSKRIACSQLRSCSAQDEFDCYFFFGVSFIIVKDNTLLALKLIHVRGLISVVLVMSLNEK